MTHPPIENATVRYADFISICRVQDPAGFAGFRVETDGLYPILPGWDVPLTDKERASLSWHPTGHYDQPALPLPCTVSQLKSFVMDAGLAGCIDEIAIAELTGATGVATAIAPERDSDATPVVELESAPMPESAPAAHVQPPPLTTGDIAFSFNGLRWTEEKWKKPLGDRPKWLLSCIAIPGVRGVSETRWNPVLIGAALIHKRDAQARSVRAKFQTVPQLRSWLDAWKTYEADNFDSE